MVRICELTHTIPCHDFLAPNHTITAWISVKLCCFFVMSKRIRWHVNWCHSNMTCHVIWHGQDDGIYWNVKLSFLTFSRHVSTCWDSMSFVGVRRHDMMPTFPTKQVTQGNDWRAIQWATRATTIVLSYAKSDSNDLANCTSNSDDSVRHVNDCNDSASHACNCNDSAGILTYPYTAMIGTEGLGASLAHVTRPHKWSNKMSICTKNKNLLRKKCNL